VILISRHLLQIMEMTPLGVDIGIYFGMEMGVYSIHEADESARFCPRKGENHQ